MKKYDQKQIPFGVCWFRCIWMMYNILFDWIALCVRLIVISKDWFNLRNTNGPPNYRRCSNFFLCRLVLLRHFSHFVLSSFGYCFANIVANLITSYCTPECEILNAFFIPNSSIFFTSTISQNISTFRDIQSFDGIFSSFLSFLFVRFFFFIFVCWSNFTCGWNVVCLSVFACGVVGVQHFAHNNTFGKSEKELL